MKGFKKGVSYIALGLIIAIIIIVYIIFIKPNYYRFNGGTIYFEPITVENISYNQFSEIYAYKGYIYISSTDGFKKIDYDGNSVWDKVYSMHNPKLVTYKDSLLVYDSLGYYALVFDENGLIYDLKFNESILGANVTEEGVVGFVHEEENQHIIRLYNNEGELISERVTSIENSGYPIEIELSSDGENLITSYIKFTSNKVESEVSVFNFGVEGAIDSEKIIAGLTYEDSFVSEVEFFDESHFVVLSDNKLEFYKLNSSIDLIKSIDITNVVEKIAFNNDNLIMIYGEDLIASSDIDEGTIVVYDKKGNLTDSYQSEESINNLVASDRYYYLVKDDSLECYNSKKIVWKSSMYKEIDELLRISDREFLIINKYGYEILRIKDI